MQKKNQKFALRSWKIFRLALLWARESAVFGKRLEISLHTLRKYIKSLRHRRSDGGGPLIYGDRELSFGATPLIHVKMHRPSSLMRFQMLHIPCINPPAESKYELDRVDGVEIETDYDEEIDSKAEEFITKFYQQMKLQRQISFLQSCNEKTITGDDS